MKLEKVKEPTLFLMEINMKVIGKMILMMDKVFLLGMMDQNMTDNGKMAKRKEKELIH